MDNDPFVNQNSIFKENINDNVKKKLGVSKSDKQQQQVILNSHGSYNELTYDSVIINGAISEEDIDDNVKNAQESEKSDGNRKRTILNNYDDAFHYECPYGNLKTNIHSFSHRVRSKHSFVKLMYLNLFNKNSFSKWLLARKYRYTNWN